MSIMTPIALGAAATTANATSLACTASGGAPKGSFLLASVGAGGPTETLGFSDTLGNIWTALPTVSVPSNIAATAGFFYCFTNAAVVAGVTTFSAAASPAGGISLSVAAYPGVDPNGPISGAQVSGVDTANTATPTASSALSPPAGGAAVALGITTYTGLFTAGAGYTMDQISAGSGAGNPRAIATEFALFATPGTSTPTFTLNAGHAWGLVGVALAPAPATSAATRYIRQGGVWVPSATTIR